VVTRCSARACALRLRAIKALRETTKKRKREEEMATHEDQACILCHNEVYLNPTMKLMMAVCGHKLYASRISSLTHNTFDHIQTTQQIKRNSTHYTTQHYTMYTYIYTQNAKRNTQHATQHIQLQQTHSNRTNNKCSCESCVTIHFLKNISMNCPDCTTPLKKNSFILQVS
jgi:hypothetical protein